MLVAQKLVMVAGLALLGQGMVGVFNWPRRRQNLVYRLFEIIASPVVKLVGASRPKVILDRHIPIAAFLLLVCSPTSGSASSTARRAATTLAQAGCEKWAAAWRDATVKQ